MKQITQQDSYATAQAVGHQPLTTEASAQSHASPCDICSAESDTGTASLTVIQFSLPILFHQHSTLIHPFITHVT